MATLPSANMNLPVPAVGSTSGPEYATDINGCMTIIDQHTHAAGSGVLITPAAISINSSLPFQNQFATQLAGLTLTAQLSTPANNTIYESGNDLHFVDGLGNDIPLTANGGIAGSPGSIANLAAPASASYVAGSSTFVWQSNTGIAANMDSGPILIRNLSPNSTNAVTLQAPAALASNYSITLPALPASQKIMTLTSGGAMAAPYTVDGSTITIVSNIIGVPDNGITGNKIANNSITDDKIFNGTITKPKLAALGQSITSSSGNYSVSTSLTDITNLSASIITTGRPVWVGFQSDGSGSSSDITAVSGTLKIQLLRDGVAIANYQIFTANGASSDAPGSSINYIDINATANTHTYTAKAQYTTLSAGSAFVRFVQLIVYEL